MAPRSKPPRPDPFEVLHLGQDASADDVRQARHRLAKELHPDVGGSSEAMQRVNAAAETALRLIRSRVDGAGSRVGPDRRRPTQRPAGRSPSAGRLARDHPSFTIEALPAEAFEALLIVANVLGQVVDDDPPYHLEALLDDPGAIWCRVEVVPDGGGSTVSLTVVADGGGSVTKVRDRFVQELNSLDWTADGPRTRLPS
jgi:hypothetical protein